VACLLRAGLAPETNESESLETLLTEVRMPETDWRLGNYQILEELGRGGMGVIYRARQRHSRRIVALKRMLSYHADARATLRRFRREAVAAASLDHPNILPIYEVGESEGLPFFSMKFAPGGSLLKASASLRDAPQRCARLISKVARAVHFAHEQGILHRDLKPGNILLDAHGEPLVSDFGLAKWLDARRELTQTLTIFGTPGYIAPEQAIGDVCCLRPTADVYSLGAVLFDLLTGRPPFLGDHALVVVRRATDESAPRLRTFRPSLDRDLETICARCLERDPAARYQSARDLAEDLERWVEGRSIEARPVSLPEKVWRWVRRNRKLATVATACVVLSIVVIWLARGRWEIERKIRRLNVTSVETFSESPPPNKSIAVLPFENLNLVEQDKFFVDGIQEDILDNLAKIADLKVIGSNSVRPYSATATRNLQEIAKALGVRYLVEGSVRRDANRVRVNAELIDARLGARCWDEHYDRDLTDFFGIQGELARAIAHQLGARISPAEEAEIQKHPTADLIAYDLYVRAKALNNAATFNAQLGETLLEVVRLLDQAISRDPLFFAAYCELAYAHDRLYFTGLDHTSERLALAEAAVEAASQIRSESGEAHLASAQHKYWGYLDYDYARDEIAIARTKLPNDPRILEILGCIDRRLGRWSESIQEFTGALDLDPRDFSTLQQVALTYQLQRRFAEMAAFLDRALTIVPQHIGTRMIQSSVALQQRADTRPLHDTIEAILASNPRAAPELAEYWFRLSLCERDTSSAARAVAAMTSQGMTTDAVRFPRAWCEAMVAKMRGDVSAAHLALINARKEIQETLRRQPDYAAGLCVLGMIDATLGRKDDAIREGRRAVELLPLSKDAINGAHAISYLASIYAWTGEKDLALQQLARSVAIPSNLNYGFLLLDPIWDPLRGDRRFEKIVASLAPSQ